MPDIRIRRDHDLGLARAREVAWRWAEQAEQQFGMACSVLEGETSDTVHFERSGCQGRLIVAADHFELDARLGFLLGAFSARIESEIERNLDTLLSESAAPAAGAKSAKARTKAAPARPSAPASAARKAAPRAKR